LYKYHTIEFFPPALALIIRAPSRVHTSFTGGIIGGKMARMEAAKLDAQERGLQFVAGPKGPKDQPQVAVNNPPRVDPNAPKVGNVKSKDDLKDLDPTKVWNEALAKGGVEPGMIIATSDFLFECAKYQHAAEFLKANLRHGIVVRPWVYEALAVALEASGANPEEVRRARLSAVALDPTDAQGFLKAARTMAEHKQYDRALAFCRQAALLEPGSAHPYAEALAMAEVAKDSKTMEWAVSKLLNQDWPTDNQAMHLKAQSRANSLAGTLEKDGRKSEADQLRAALQRLRQRDLEINLSWDMAGGETADLSLEIKEPTGGVASHKQPQTTGGGAYQGTDLKNQKRVTYTAAQAFSGQYQISVRRNWGQPLNNRATLEIIENKGTPKEVRRLEIVKLDGKMEFSVELKNGRRTELAHVPPPNMQKQQAKDESSKATTSALSKLRELAHPDYTGATAVRGGASTPGSRLPTAPAGGKDQPTTMASITGVSNGQVPVATQLRVGPGGQDPALILNPIFQGGVNRPSLNLPLIPGGN
jgi:tetratricopeptide (TPR) repeat protein